MLLATLLPKRRKEKKKAVLLPTERERERERERESNLKKTLAFLSIKKKIYSQSVFSQFWRKHFGGPGEIKTPKPYNLFSFLPTQPNTLQKSFSSYFISKVFHPPYFPSKQTHPKSLDSSLKIILHGVIGLKISHIIQDTIIEKCRLLSGASFHLQPGCKQKQTKSRNIGHKSFSTLYL